MVRIYIKDTIKSYKHEVHRSPTLHCFQEFLLWLPGSLKIIFYLVLYEWGIR